MSDEQKSGLEDQLRLLLKREQPPSGFTERVMSRVSVTTAHSMRGIPAWRERLHSVLSMVSLRWAAAAALMCLLIAAGVIRHREYRAAKAEGEIARQQAILALRIASAKLNVALRQVQEVERGRRTGNE